MCLSKNSTLHAHQPNLNRETWLNLSLIKISQLDSIYCNKHVYNHRCNLVSQTRSHKHVYALSLNRVQINWIIKDMLWYGTDQHFPVVLFVMLYKVVLTFESVDEILTCDHSNESYWAVLSCGAVYYAVQGGSNFWGCGWNRKVWPFKWKLLSSTFLWCCLLCCTRFFWLLRLSVK